jgi:CMP-N-acetylneuraminic acid synthetase
MTQRIAIIPARGGSKRIKHKNIKFFCGKEMIAWSIEAALESGCFDLIIVSTDDETIVKVANKYGVLEIPSKFLIDPKGNIVLSKTSFLEIQKYLEKRKIKM